MLANLHGIVPKDVLFLTNSFFLSPIRGFRDGSFSKTVPLERIVVGASYTPEKLLIGRESANPEIIYSDDYFKTRHTILKQGGTFLITQDYLIAHKYREGGYKLDTLYVGSSNTNHYELEPFIFASKNLKDGGKLSADYEIVDVKEGRIILKINEAHSNHQLGNLYVSDMTGTRLTKSAQNYRRGFAKLGESEGVFLGTFIDPQAVASANSSDELEKHKITLITFNNAGTWQFLRPPAINSKGEKIECKKEDGCALHLRSDQAQKTKTSLGVVIGVGNVGKYLSSSKSGLNTYLSRDGGLSWNEVRKSLFFISGTNNNNNLI